MWTLPIPDVLSAHTGLINDHVFLTKTPAHHIYHYHLLEFVTDILTYLIVFIDPNVDNPNCTIEAVVDQTTAANNNLQEKSHLQV